MLEPRTMIQDFEGFRVWIQQVDPRTDSLHDILIHQLDRGGAAPTVITARTGVVHLTDAGNTWKFTLHNGETHTPDRAEPRRYARVSFQELVVDVPNIDSRLHRSDKSYRTDREMPIEEMQERVDAARVRESTQIAEQGERLFADVRFVTNLLEVDSASRANAGKPLPDSLRDTATGKRTAKATKSVKDAKTGAPGQKPTTPGGHRIQDSLAHAKAARARDLVQGVHSIQSAIRATADGKTIITPKWKPPDESPSRDLASLVESRQRETRMAKEQIKTEHDEGDRFLVEIHKKFSIPFACIVFVLVGVPLGIMARSGGVGTGVAYSITFFVLYWVGLIGGEALADRGTIEPVVAMWGPNVILGALGVFLISRMGREVQFFRYRWLLDPLRRLGFRKKPT